MRKYIKNSIYRIFSRNKHKNKCVSYKIEYSYNSKGNSTNIIYKIIFVLLLRNMESVVNGSLG